MLKRKIIDGNMFKDQSNKVYKLESSNRILKLIIDINNQLLKYEDNQTFYDFILERAVMSIEKATHGSLMLLNEDNKLNCISLFGYSPIFKELVLELEHAFIWEKTNGKLDKSVIIDDIVEFNKTHLSNKELDLFTAEHPPEVITTISTPLRIDGKFYGLINIDSKTKGAFTEADLELISLFRTQVEIALKNKFLLEKTIYLSRFDKLTDIYNRSYFEEIILDFIKKAKRYSEVFSLVIIDIDNLKVVNDTFGHKVGDQMLTDFCKLFKKSVRESDIFARFGGDEFICVFFSSNKENTDKKIKSIIESTDKFLETTKRPYKINFSYGISEFPNDSILYDALVNMADKKMYEMKLKTKSSK